MSEEKRSNVIPWIGAVSIALILTAALAALAFGTALADVMVSTSPNANPEAGLTVHMVAIAMGGLSSWIFPFAWPVERARKPLLIAGLGLLGLGVVTYLVGLTVLLGAF